MSHSFYYIAYLTLRTKMPLFSASNCDPEQLPDILNGRKYRVSYDYDDPAGLFDLYLRTVLFIQLCFIYLSFYVGEEYAGENVSIQLQQGLQTSRWVEILSRNSPSQRLNKYCRQAPRKSTVPSLAGVWTEPLSVSTQVRNINKYFTKFIKLIIL